MTKKCGTLKHKKLIIIYKNGKRNFNNWWYWNGKSYCNKTPVFLKDAYIEKILVSKTISFGEEKYKYFIGYLIMRIKLSNYIQCFLKQAFMMDKLWWAN